MRTLAAACLVLACVWAGATFPIAAIVALGAFLTIGGVCEVVRNG